MNRCLFNYLATVILLLGPSALAQAEEPSKEGKQSLLNECAACHTPGEDGTLSRISEQRKTPEGWEMTINRMRMIHGLTLSGRDIPIAKDAVRELVKHLADTQGLAPEESAPYRYLIEQDLNQVEDFDPELAVMCGRCHSSARFALQRRTEGEWEKLVHFHLGQYPSIEYSLYGRDRDWLAQALEEVVPTLADKYPFESSAWSDWQKAEKPALEGEWVLSGYMAGRGQMVATMQVEKAGVDNYSLTLEARFSDGNVLKGKGNSIVYTGYDWRGQISLGDETFRQVFAADSESGQLTGRMYLKNQELQGMAISAVRADTAEILSVYPAHIQRGQSQQITIAGTGLTGEITLPAGVAVKEVVARDESTIRLIIEAGADAIPGSGAVRVGDVEIDGALTTYDKLDALRVEPAYGIARVGNNGGSTPKVNAEFSAVGIDYGEDGLPGTADDLELGYMEGVSWSVSPWNEAAEQDEDVRFAGIMNDASGIFTPADAGPNPERRRSTNNAGNLKVTASLQEGADSITGEAQLVVTIQRWNNPPLK